MIHQLNVLLLLVTSCTLVAFYDINYDFLTDRLSKPSKRWPDLLIILVQKSVLYDCKCRIAKNKCLFAY